jgi:hypothetical protein
MSILSGLTTPKSTVSSTARADRPAAKYWLNVGYDINGRFINLPTGIAIDTAEPVKVSGTDEEWLQTQTARNDLLKALQEAGDNLEPGAEIELNLTVKLRRVNEKTEIKSEDNPFSVNFAGLIAKAPAAA